PLLEQCRDGLRRRNARPDHPYSLILQWTLGTAYLRAGRAGDAIPLLRASCDGFAKLFGPSAPRTWTPRHTLGWAYLEAGQTDAGVAAFEANLAIAPPALEVESTNALAAAYRQAGRTAEAIALLEKPLKRLRDQSGPDDPQVLILTQGLSSVY